MTTIELDAPTGFGASLLHDAHLPASTRSASARADRRRTASQQLQAAMAGIRAYYSSGRARMRFAAASVLLFYVGGGLMFWLHAIYRGEQGPPIPHVWHWMMDSTLGFVGLAPVLVAMLPLASRLTARRRHLEPVVVGGLFALLTTPGPILHNLIAGAGTPLADTATSVFGTDPHVAASHVHAVENSMVTEVLLQLGVGLVAYVVLAKLVWWALPSSRSARAASMALHPSTQPA